jgi:uncharacterized repeat protein (TIGR01451 family)
MDQMNAWKADYIFEKAKSSGVYLKTVITEKSDEAITSIKVDGSTGSPNNGDFYASDSHPSRWLQKTWWRYITARFGCFSSVHSWELCNEGDPFDSRHYAAANALAEYIHSNDHNRIMCSTSFWHSIPMDFWKASSCDYIDVHEYFGPQVGSTGSHGPRFYAWFDSYDNVPLPISSAAGERSLDTTVKHSGAACHKVVAHDGGVDINNARTGYLAPYHIGIDPTHTYTLRYWAKGTNITNIPSLAWIRPTVSIVFSKAYHENDFVGEQVANANLGTYDWMQFQKTAIVPHLAANTANIYIMCTRGTAGAGDGTFWVDDVEFIDETTGETLLLDGGMEASRIDYDSALAVQKYGLLFNSYGGRIGKPTIWGETGIRGQNVFGSPYKGYGYTDENQQLVDDLSGVHLKKMVWVHAGPCSPNMLYWWTDNATKKNLWRYFGAFQSFMAGIPVSNGQYVDARAVTSNVALRALGQKDLSANQCHLWIDNAPYNWKNVVDGVSVPPASGNVTVGGLKDALYQIDWWNTDDGTVSSTQQIHSSGGNLVLSVQNLVSDVACKIYPAPAKVDLRVLVPSAEVVPGQIITVTVEYTNSGESEGRSVAVTAAVPLELEYVSGSAEESGGVWNSGTQSVTWLIDSLSSHETGTRTFRARVK